MKNMFTINTALVLFSVLGSCTVDNSFDVYPIAGEGIDDIPIREVTTNYYIDPVSGDDTNDGKAEDKAWKSFINVNGLELLAGDSLLLKAGSTFNAVFKVENAKGTSKQPVVIGSYGQGTKPAIEAPDNSKEAVHIYNCTDIIVENLDIKNYGTDAEMKDRTGLRVQLQDYGTAHNVIIRKIDVHDVNGSLLKNNGEGHGILVMNGGDKTISIYDGLTIEDCTIKRCSRNALKMSAYYERVNWHPNLNVIIRRNLIEEVPGDGIVPIGCDGAIVEYNIMRNCTDPWNNMQEAAAGIWPWSCDNTVIQFNEVSDQKAPWDGQGYDSDFNCNNTTIQYNYSHDNYGGFILICNAGDALYNDGNNNSDIRGNISINDGCRPHTIYHDPNGDWFSPIFHISGPLKNCSVSNNIVHVMKRTIPEQQKTFVQFGNWNGYPDVVNLKSNLFYSEEQGCNFILSNATNVTYSGNWYLNLNSQALSTVTDENMMKQNDEYLNIISSNSNIEEALATKLLRKVEMPVGTITTVDKDAINAFFSN